MDWHSREKMQERFGDAHRKRVEWLEDILAGLLSNGVSKDEIEVQEWPDNVTIVAVRGEPKYKFQIKIG